MTSKRVASLAGQVLRDRVPSLFKSIAGSALSQTIKEKSGDTARGLFGSVIRVNLFGG